MKERLIYDEAWMARIARAACLTLTAEEMDRFCKDVGGDAERLRRLPTADAEEAWQSRAVGLDALREDGAAPGLPREALQACAKTADGCFLVPQILDDGGDENE